MIFDRFGFRGARTSVSARKKKTKKKTKTARERATVIDVSAPENRADSFVIVNNDQDSLEIRRLRHCHTVITLHCRLFTGRTGANPLNSRGLSSRDKGPGWRSGKRERGKKKGTKSRRHRPSPIRDGAWLGFSPRVVARARRDAPPR